MRLLALLPVLMSAAALVLTFLCLFAGSSKSFMQDYAVLTLNTSRIGQDLFNTSQSSSNPLVSLLDNITNTIGNDVEDAITSFAKDLGLHDFYSAHLMDYCEGYYTPVPLPNATLPKSDIKQNITSCSNHTAMWNFDPRQILQRELNESGHSNINLITDLDWPKAIDEGITTLRTAARAMFVLYCIAIGLIGIALIVAAISVFLNGRLSAFFNIVLDWLALVVVGVASAIATAIAVKGADVINENGEEVGVSAKRGNKFLAITWAATGLMLVASIVWCFECVVGRRRRSYGETSKYG